MSWARASTYLALAAVLATALWATTPAAPPAAPPAQPAPEIVGVIVEAGGRRVAARREDGRWRVAPADATVTSDLIDALLAAILEAPAEPVAAAADRHAEFGLDTPDARVTLQRLEAPAVTLLIGDVTPADTGVYGQLVGNPQVVLMGLNVRYYVELITRPAQ